KAGRTVAEERVADGAMLHDWLAASHRHLPGFPIVLMGRGCGAGIAAGVAAIRSAAAMVLFSPCDAVPSAPRRLSLLKRRLPSATGQVFQFRHPAPVLVLRAEKDAVVTAA